MESPIQLNPEQKAEWLAKRVTRFKERYEALVAETGLRHFAYISTPVGPISLPMLILPVKQEQALMAEEPAEAPEAPQNKVDTKSN